MTRRFLAALLALVLAVPAAAGSPPYGIGYRQPSSRGALRDVDPTHDYVDFGLVTAWWRELEPAPGVYDIARAQELLAPWVAAGKPAQLSIHPYATPGDVPTWWLSEGLSLIDEDSLVAWTPVARTKWQTLLAVLRGAGIPLAHTYGHLGHGACTTEAGTATLAYGAGWTEAAWESYALVEAEDGAAYEFARLILRDPSEDNYRDLVRAIAEAAAEDGAILIPLIYDADQEILGPDAERFLADLGEVGIGDDWPVVVPPDRLSAPATLGRTPQVATQNIRWLMRQGYPLRWLVIGHTELDMATEGDPTFDQEWRTRLRGIQAHLKEGSW